MAPECLNLGAGNKFFELFKKILIITLLYYL
jgi:hypothetical protein